MCSRAQPQRSATDPESFVAELADAGLGAVDVLTDFRLPHTSTEFDLMLAGVHPQTGRPSYVAVELKGWRAVRTESTNSELVTVVPSGFPTIHPLLAVGKRIAYLREHLLTLNDRDDIVSGLVYLPHACDRDVRALLNDDHCEGLRVFTGESRAAMFDLLRTIVAPDPSGKAVEALIDGPVRERRRLMAAAASEIGSHSEFVFLGSQELARSAVLHAVGRAAESDERQTLIISGQAGTGKSTLAIALLGELRRQGYRVLHATGSRALTTTLRKVVGSETPGTRKLFTYFNSYITAEPDFLDVLICDEAHRIRESSVNRFTRRDHRTGVPQVVELIRAARVSVFFLDTEQAVRPGEVGTEELISTAAEANGRTVHRITLDEQFGADGSREYLKWTRRLLKPDSGQVIPPTWTGSQQFTIEVVDTPWELEERLVYQQGIGHTVRMVAGMCWPWSKPTPGEPLPLDIRIGDWQRPWSVNGDRGVSGAPAASLWATDPAGIGQIGTVYNAQGFEFDWTGVIIGPDLVWRTDRWVARRAKNCDPLIRRLDERDVEMYVMRIYYVLLSRSRKGTIIYSTDLETRQMLHEAVEPRIG